MSYADDLAKDRDKYLRERNKFIVLARDLVAAYDKVGGPLAVDPAVAKTRKALEKFDAEPTIVERLGAE